MRLSSTPSSNSLRRTPTYRGGVCAPCSSVPLVQMSVVVSPSPPAACLQGLWAGMLIAWAPMLLLLRRSWEKLQDAIQQIFNENAGELSFEELYRTGYNMVLHKHGDMLYQNVETVLKERSGTLCEKVAQNTDKTLVPPPISEACRFPAPCACAGGSSHASARMRMTVVHLPRWYTCNGQTPLARGT